MGTGSVTSKSGKVTARRIITGIEIEGAASDEVLKAAFETMDRLNTGSVSGAQGVEAGEAIVTGFRYLNPKAPDRQALLAEMKALRESAAELQKQPEAAVPAAAAARALDDAVAEAQKPQPYGKQVVSLLRSTVEFMTDAGKLLEAADKAGPLIAKALPTAVVLYEVGKKLFGG